MRTACEFMASIVIGLLAGGLAGLGMTWNRGGVGLVRNILKACVRKLPAAPFRGDTPHPACEGRFCYHPK